MTFSQIDTFYRHNTVHGLKPFKCDTCEKTFTERSALKKTHKNAYRRKTILLWFMWKDILTTQFLNLSQDNLYRREAIQMWFMIKIHQLSIRGFIQERSHILVINMKSNSHKKVIWQDARGSIQERSYTFECYAILLHF